LKKRLSARMILEIQRLAPAVGIREPTEPPLIERRLRMMTHILTHSI